LTFIAQKRFTTQRCILKIPLCVALPQAGAAGSEGTPRAFALRDCGIRAVAIAGIAMEIGIEPTARHAADLGIIPVVIEPVVIEDSCGAGHADAAQRSCEALHFAGDAIMTDTEAFCAAPGKRGG
jgi:nicotinamidase-related amidase